MSALVLCRFAHFMAVMLAFGASAYLALAAPAPLRRALSPPVRRLALIASLVALATAILWLAFETASMADDWSAAIDLHMIRAVIADTAFGHAWLARLVLAAGLVAAFAVVPPRRWAAITLLSGLLLASLALVGHAAMQTGYYGALHRANHAVHFIAAGAWIGGLIPFLLCLRVPSNDALAGEAVVAMTRFSDWGRYVVAAIVLTGVVNIALISGRAPLPPTTPYRALLDAKIAIVAFMIALALINRAWLAPRIFESAPALAALKTTCLIEVALGTIAVALVSVFALFDPT